MAEKTNLLRRYIWLLDTLQNQRLTFAQISEKWENSYELNDDNAPLPLRTFHNHRKAIYEIFGIEIANFICLNIKFANEKTSARKVYRR